MQKFKSLIYPVLIILLGSISILGGFFSFLIFPATGLLMWFLVQDDRVKFEWKTVIIGVSFFVIFVAWDFIRFDKMSLMFSLIYTLSIMAAIEAWQFTAYSRANVWGLMNLVVFWIGMEYLMLVWLPFDISGWLIGTPLLINDDMTNNWLIYLGAQGYSLLVLIVGLLLFKSFHKGIDFLFLLAALLIVVIPAIINPDIVENEVYYAQGEWIGRTCIWISVLILAYSFVKQKTTKE